MRKRRSRGFGSSSKAHYQDVEFFLEAIESDIAWVYEQRTREDTSIPCSVEGRVLKQILCNYCRLETSLISSDRSLDRSLEKRVDRVDQVIPRMWDDFESICFKSGGHE